MTCESLSDRGKYVMHGSGSNIWFDKSVCLIAFNDGRIGFNAEHSWGDAPTLGHIVEFSMTNECVYKAVLAISFYCLLNSDRGVILLSLIR
jgi:hypothetical protein